MKMKVGVRDNGRCYSMHVSKDTSELEFRDANGATRCIPRYLRTSFMEIRSFRPF